MAAPTVDATSTATPNNSASSLTWAHTCGASATHILVAAGGWRAGGSNVNSVTYDGVALANVSGSSGTWDTNGRVTWWLLASPTTGVSANVIVTFNGAATESNAAAVSVIGATSVLDGTAASGSSGTASVTVPNVTANDLVLDIMAVYANVATIGANQSPLWNQTDTGAFTRTAGSSQLGSDGGVMTWTFGSHVWGSSGVRVVGSVAATKFLLVRN